MERVLFICTGNIARSQMAEALLRFHGGDRFEVYSAGLEPKTIPEETVEALREAGVPMAEGARSKHMDEFRGQEFDYVITVCDSARQECPYFPGKQVLHWDIEDPAVAIGDGATRMESFRKRATRSGRGSSRSCGSTRPLLSHRSNSRLSTRPRHGRR